LPQFRPYIKAAAYLVGHSADLITVSARTGLTWCDVVDFHNACHAIGLVERHLQAEPINTVVDESVRELCRLISERMPR
jgi:hypothetical protein